MKMLKRVWIPLVIVIVVAVGGFAISRWHKIFGSEEQTSASGGAAGDIVSFNPKQVVLEVFGSPGTVADINYLDVNAQPQRVDEAVLPWSYTITTTQPAVVANVVAQGNSNSIGCRIIVDGIVKDERWVNEVAGYTFCLMKSA